MDRIISLVVLILGIVLVLYAFSALDSFSSDVSRFFTGSPTDKTMWMLIGGILAIGIGAGGLLRRSR